MTWISRHWQKLRDKKYREEFVGAQVRRAIPFQIRALMKRRDLSQQQLADAAGLTQGAVSRAADLDYGRMTLHTIVRIAAGLDVAFVGAFVPFSKLEGFYDRMSEAELGQIATFDEEDQAFNTEASVSPGAGVDAFTSTSLEDERITTDDTASNAKQHVVVVDVGRKRMAKAVMPYGNTADDLRAGVLP